MSEIEEKVLALVNAEQAKSGCLPIGDYHGPCMKALCRAIEQHEAFRQEVSDAVVAAKAYYEVPMYDLSAFIIAKPDPLVEVCYSMGLKVTGHELREALATRGLEIVKKEPSQ